MIKANEIRVGNYVEYSTISDDYTKVLRKIYVNDLIRIYECDYYFIYNPIPLTEEIFLKCGFNKLKDDNWGDFIDMWVDKVDFVCVLIKDNVFIGKDSKTNIYYFLVTRTGNGEYMYFEAISAPMEYLHTLQNYYVTFKGEELEINL